MYSPQNSLAIRHSIALHPLTIVVVSHARHLVVSARGRGTKEVPALRAARIPAFMTDVPPELDLVAPFQYTH